MGQIDVFSVGLEVAKCLSKNVIRNRPLLSDVCFSI
jgi:hypothetical protein